MIAPINIPNFCKTSPDLLGELNPERVKRNGGKTEDNGNQEKEGTKNHQHK